MLDGDTQELIATDRGLERALVALIFADNANVEKLGNLKPEDFSDHGYRAIFAGALNMQAEGRPVNIVTLKARLEGITFDDGSLGLDVVRSLSVGGALPPVQDIASRLKILSTKRKMAEYLKGISEQITEESQSVPRLAADVIGQMNDILAIGNSEIRIEPHIYDAAQDFIERLQSGDDPIEIPTGLKDLDDATGGWHRGQFAILAGRPGMGKSSVALSSMLRTAEKGHGVLFFSLEMTRDQLVARALTDYAYTNPTIAYSDLKPGRVSGAHVRRLYEAAERFKNMPIIIDTRNGLTVGDITARARKAVEEFKEQGRELALVVVDHLLKVRPSSRYAGQPVKELDEISEGMCVLAKLLNVAALGLHQLNRQVESRDNQRPMLSDLRGSGTLEQDADLVLFAYRPAYQFERLLQEPDKRAEAEAAAEALKHELELQIAKQRNGPTTALNFWIDMQANVVRDRTWAR